MRCDRHHTCRSRAARRAVRSAATAAPQMRASAVVRSFAEGNAATMGTS